MSRKLNYDLIVITFLLDVYLIFQYQTIDVAPHDVSFYCRRVLVVHISLTSNNHGGLADSIACLNMGLTTNRYYRDGQASFGHGVFGFVLAVFLVCQYQTRYGTPHSNRYRPADCHNYDY